MYNTRPELEREIARLKAIQQRGPVDGKIWTPNSLRWRIDSLERYRLKFNWPRYYRLRVWLSDALERLSHWVCP